MFKPAKQNRIFEDVVEQIQNAILSGQVKPGETLPSERDLRDVFRVSRGTIREALRVLEQKGLIEIKLGVGGGAVVRDVPTDKLGETLALLIRSRKISLEHLAEFRKGVEGDITALAAQRATDRDIQNLEHILKKAREYCDKGTEFVRQFLEVDMKFHLTLSQISGNPVYETVERIVQGNIIPYYETFLDMGGGKLRENYDDLHKIVKAIKQKHPEEARAIAREHVAKYAAYMEKRKSENGIQKD